MRLFIRVYSNCDICGKKTDVRKTPKIAISDGCICKDCCEAAQNKSLGDKGEMLLNDTLKWLVDKDDTIENVKFRIVKRAENREKFKRIENFNATRILSDLVCVNDERREWHVGKSGRFYPSIDIYSMDGIINVWSISDYSENISTESEIIKKGGVGRAIIGGAIAGPTGAIVGAITRKEVVTSHNHIETSHIGIVHWLQLDKNGVEQIHKIDLGIGSKATAAEHAIRSFIY